MRFEKQSKVFCFSPPSSLLAILWPFLHHRLITMDRKESSASLRAKISLYFSLFICDECCESLGRRRRQNFYYRFYPTTPGNHCGHMLVRLVAYKAAVSGYKLSLCTKMVHITVAYEEIWIQRTCLTDDTIWIQEGRVLGQTLFGKRYGQDKWKKKWGKA